MEPKRRFNSTDIYNDFVNFFSDLKVVSTSDVPVMSSPQVCHCGQRSLSWKVVSLDVQQQCSWLNQKPTRQIPSFMSVSQWAAMSMPPARAPEPGGKQVTATLPPDSTTNI